MRLRQTVVSGTSVTRLLGVALLAGSAAACSSDASRFSYQNTDGLTTASVPQPSSDRLAPMAAVGGNQLPQGYPQAQAYPQAASSNQRGFPQAPSSVSQAFPGDYRSSPQGYDPTSTGSIPGSVARSASSSSNLINNGGATVARKALPSAQPVMEPMNRPVAQAPQSQAFPERPQQLSSAVPVSARFKDAEPVLAPDPIVTGTAPQSAGWTTTGATRITLGEGETIYNLSKRYGVPASEIMKANGIADASRVSSGKQLLIPIYVYSRQAPVSAPDNNPKTRSANSSSGQVGEVKHDRLPVPGQAPVREVAVLPSAPSLRNPGSASVANGAVSGTASSSGEGASGVYVVKSGDTLSKIARNHGVSVDTLKSANDLTASNIRIGQTLTIPGAAGSKLNPSSTASVNNSSSPKAYTPPVNVAGDSVAAKTKGDTASVAPAATGIDKFRWPARGQVITGFAKTENGKRNDGIDISMPTGTPVKAAENGVVIYSGDGLKEYGKTVLIRHDDGLVTVYAHADKLNVNRGDKVARGQVIASSGMTGVAKTPRLHFEVRKNASPVDPTKYLE
ncbi:peptidoglycan DD-metalloendopeptidase family protein [Hoeflea sp. AS60]|uniref:peptidoglycan DD-metalloendopeptidase family protein n=1 Tax=Hoeflea sp. AS60 TaxID=3135780 RepID=UPI003172FB12